METFDSTAAGLVAQVDWVFTNVPVPPVFLGCVVVGGAVFALWYAINPFPPVAPPQAPRVARGTVSPVADGPPVRVDWERTQVVNGTMVAGRARAETVAEPPADYDPSYVPPAYSHHLPPPTVPGKV
jgi:hypothetical protein